MSKKCVLLCLFVCSGCHLCSSCRRRSLVESSAHHLLQGDQWGGDQICGLRRLRQSKDRLTQTNKVRISFLKHELCCDNDSRVHVFFSYCKWTNNVCCDASVYVELLFLKLETEPLNLLLFFFFPFRSDFVTLPFQGAEVLLDNIAPLSGTTWTTFLLFACSFPPVHLIDGQTSNVKSSE